MNSDATEPVTTRPVRPADLALFARMWTRLSPDTVYRRFHAPVPRLSAKDVRHLIEVDHDLREALVATVHGEEGEEVVGVARYDRSAEEPGTATFAVMVEDRMQGRGLGRRLLVEVIGLAEDRGVQNFALEVQADNRRTLRLIEQVFPAARSHVSWGIKEFSGPLPHRAGHGAGHHAAA